jgi:hypothetical protein
MAAQDGKFDYLVRLARPLPDCVFETLGEFESDILKMVSALSAPDMRILAEIRDAIWNAGDEEALARYLGSEGTDDQEKERGRLVSLVMVLQLLKDQDLPPFGEYPDVMVGVPEAIDWNGFPGKIAYICDYADRYAVSWDAGVQERFLETLEDEQVQELRALGARLRRAGHAALIFQWQESAQSRGNLKQTTKIEALLNVFMMLEIEIE